MRVEEGDFLREWLEDSKAALQAFQEFDYSAEEMERRVGEIGYRSVRSAMEHWKHTHLVLERFNNEKVFKDLWDILRMNDLECNGFAFSSANGGFPARVLRTLEYWYKVPKFTSAERKAHNRKIVATCNTLIDLLEQVAYTAEIDVDFSAFYRLKPEEVATLFDWFQSPKSWREEINGGRYRAFLGLKNAGLNPLWAVDYIKQRALNSYEPVTLPTKVRAKGAIKTYMIDRLWVDLDLSVFNMTRSDLVSKEMFAEVVALVADCDCSADDVRKVLAGGRKEDSSP